VVSCLIGKLASPIIVIGPYLKMIRETNLSYIFFSFNYYIQYFVSVFILQQLETMSIRNCKHGLIFYLRPNKQMKIR
jgi:hypothetical protein